MDYYARWIEVAKLSQTTSSSVISNMSSMFACYGIPEVVVSDNGPHFSADGFEEFARTYGFEHKPSSPYYPQANGEAERAVQTVKNFLKRASDLYLVMLAYRSSPLALGYTPSKLLMCREQCTTVPISRELRNQQFQTSAK